MLIVTAYILPVVCGVLGAGIVLVVAVSATVCACVIRKKQKNQMLEEPSVRTPLLGSPISPQKRMFLEEIVPDATKFNSFGSEYMIVMIFDNIL